MKLSAEWRVRNSEWNNCQAGDKGHTPHSALHTPNSKGFTLLEVMLAVAILSIVIVSLMGLQSRSSRDVMLAEHITSATLLAKRVMTETLLVKPLLPLEKDGEFPEEEFADYTWKKVVSVIPVQNFVITEVRVAVLWKEGEREEKVELVSYE